MHWCRPYEEMFTFPPLSLSPSLPPSLPPTDPSTPSPAESDASPVLPLGGPSLPPRPSSLRDQTRRRRRRRRRRVCGSPPLPPSQEAGQWGLEQPQSGGGRAAELREEPSGGQDQRGQECAILSHQGSEGERTLLHFLYIEGWMRR